jgi:hypothetical protein
MYYLQTVEDTKIWEQVDEYTWSNYLHAVRTDGQPRYTGNRVRCDGNRIDIEAQGLDASLCIISRFCGVRGTEAPGSVAGGFVRTQEYIPFVKGKRKWLHGKDGNNYAARRVESVPAQKVIGEQM